MQCYWSAGDKRMELNIGLSRIPGENNGVRMDTSESREELMSFILRVWCCQLMFEKMIKSE